MKKNFSYLFLCVLCASGITSCYSPLKAISSTEAVQDSLHINYSKESFVQLSTSDSLWHLDMRYTTSDNFLHQPLYPCEACFLRKHTAIQLYKAAQLFRSMGYTLLLFDCYRPLYIQKKMWKQLPDANYVADPKKGSLHNRGGAVDLSLLDSTGKEVDMGTAFDAFTPLAWHNAEGLSEEAKKNRLLLKSVMEKCGFKALKSEWWHYHLPDISTYSLENKKWRCR